MTDIYHITHINNLPGIIQSNQLLSDSEITKRKVEHRGIAHQHIKVRRAERNVPIASGGTLADYVPFYFAPRSPMLYSIRHGYVEGYKGGQGNIMHLVASAERITADGISFAFTDGHAEVAISRFFEDLHELDQIDWDLMESRRWYDTQNYPDRKRRRQAEFLVYLNLPWDYIQEIGVCSATIKQQVFQILNQTGVNHQSNVIV